MEPRSRPRHTSQGQYFSVEDYYLGTNKLCTSCEQQRPEYDHFHCLVCHSNLKTPVNFRNMNNRLKRHYSRFSIAKKFNGKYYPAHSLQNPPRSAATAFKDLTSEDKTLVREGILAFCTAVHNLSWKSQACMNNIMQEVVDCNYSSSATKAAAICKGLFGLEAELKLKNELQQVKHIAVAFDSSTIHNVKVLPIIATFFTSQKGLQHRLLALVDLKQGGNADCTAWAVKKILQIYGISKKVTAIVADNCPTNFGSFDRQGPNNIFHHLTEEFGDKLIGVGCLAHIVNNSLKNSVEKLNFGEKDLNTFLAQVHQYFMHSNSNRVENIYLIRAQLGGEQTYSSNKPPTKSYSKTRWLSTGPAINAIINQWHLFDIYFQMESSGKHVETFKKFFENRNSLPLLITLRTLAAEVEEAVCSMEGKDVDLMTAIKIFDALRQKILQYREEITMPRDAAGMIEHWEENYQLDFHLQLWELYDDIQSYMVKWSGWTNSLKLHRWATLDSTLSEEAVTSSAETIKENCRINGDELKKNVEDANVFINTRLESWKTLTTSERWSNLINSVPNLDALEKAAQFILTLPGTNATIERLFSEIRHYWTDSKDSMPLATVNTIMKIRYNHERDCQKVLQMLITDTELRRKVRENNKYDEAKLKNAHSLVNIMQSYGQEEEDDIYWEEFIWQDCGSDQSSNASDPSYEDDFPSDDDDDDDYLDEEVGLSELDRLAEEVVIMETEVQEPDRQLPTELDCMEYEHNYEGPLQVESPWHR